MTHTLYHERQHTMKDLTEMPDPELTAGIKPVHTLELGAEQPAVYRDGKAIGWLPVPRDGLINHVEPDFHATVLDALNGSPAAIAAAIEQVRENHAPKGEVKPNQFGVFMTNYNDVYDLRSGDGRFICSASYEETRSKADDLNTYYSITGDPSDLGCHEPASVSESPASVEPDETDAEGYRFVGETEPAPDASPWLGAPQGVEITVHLGECGSVVIEAETIESINPSRYPDGKYLTQIHTTGGDTIADETPDEIRALCVAAIAEYEANRKWSAIDDYYVGGTLLDPSKLDSHGTVVRYDAKTKTVTTASGDVFCLNDYPDLIISLPKLNCTFPTGGLEISGVTFRPSHITKGNIYNDCVIQCPQEIIDRIAALEEKLEAYGRRVKSREEVESNDA